MWFKMCQFKKDFQINTFEDIYKKIEFKSYLTLIK